MTTPNESLVPGAAAVAAAAAVEPAPARHVKCAYCECVLAADGGVIRTSERVRALNKQEDRIEQLRIDLAKVEGDLTTARAELATAQATLAGRKAQTEDW